MANYDFTSLSSFDFEVLVRDLLQKELNISLESFKTGRDGGIDLRYSRGKGQNIVVQCKHYVASGYHQLKAAVKNEVRKLGNLKPTRYILVTSVGLTPNNKDELFSILSPHCKEISDIYGKEDVNNMLKKFDEVERKNFKLWLTSQTVLERLLNNAVYNQSRRKVEAIQKKLKIYVQNESYSMAKDILKEINYCIISGNPGIGKTTLADILTVDYIAQGYEVIVINNSITEGYSAFNQSRKQLFYYDDFLGQTNLVEKLGKNEDQSLLDFIDMIQDSENGKFILTTREYILNQAKFTYEKLARSHFDIKKCTIKLSDYTKMHRAKILFNHIYFSAIPNEYKQELLKNRNYKRIIEHDNYSPRIIDWMTDYKRIPDIPVQQYMIKFMGVLNNPSELWDHAFRKQISFAAQQLLLAAISMPPEMLLEDLREAFSSIYKYRSGKYNHTIMPNDFYDALKEVESTFIQIDKVEEERLIRFHNPSVRDYLEGYLSHNQADYEDIVESSVFFEQSVVLWNLQSTDSGTDTKLAFKIPRQIIESMIRNIKSDDVRLDAYSFYYVSKKKSTFEERLSYAIKIAGEINMDVSKDIVERSLKMLNERVQQGAYDKDTIIGVIKELNESPIRSMLDMQVVNNVLDNVKKDLVGNMSGIKEIWYMLAFSEVAPEMFSRLEIDTIRDEFLELYESEVDDIIDRFEASELDEFANMIEEIVEYLDIEVSPEVDVLRDIASSKEYPDHEPDMDDDDRWDIDDRGDQGRSTDDLIDDMFGSLE